MKVLHTQLVSTHDALLYNNCSTWNKYSYIYIHITVMQVVILTKLEIALPVYWNSSTRHFLLHTFDFIQNMGHFWAFSMLGVERIHVMIKKLGKSKRNIMRSIQLNNDRLIESQVTWRFDKKTKWASEGSASSLHAKKPIAEPLLVVQPRGALTKKMAGPQLFQWLEDEWSVKHVGFRKFRDERFEAHVRVGKRNAKNNRKNFVAPSSYREWKDPKHTPEQKRWQTMDNCVWTVNAATLDGVLFRTRPSQDLKKTKTDNSCVVGEVEVEVNNKKVVQKCYGVIQKFYVHFMYPPRKRDTYKLTAEKLAKLDTPWILCARCDWWEPKGEHPNTGLTQVTPNKYWVSGCPLQNLQNCINKNVVFWPSKPFNIEDFDDDGEPTTNLKKGKYDFSGTGLYDVITH